MKIVSLEFPENLCTCFNAIIYADFKKKAKIALTELNNLAFLF